VAVLFAGCIESDREEARYEGVPTSIWVLRMRDEDVAVRQEAARALGVLGPSELEETLTPLLEALQDPDPMVRYHALVSIGKLRPPARKASVAVGRAINDKDKRVVKAAIQVYRQLEVSRPSSLNAN
jgi:HEAT repeat protein